MNRSETLFVAYAALWLLCFIWAFWRTASADSVRAAVRGLPIAVSPTWLVTCLAAYNSGQFGLAFRVYSIAVVSLVLLWMMQYAVDPDSGPVDSEYEEGRAGVALDLPLPAQIALVIGMTVFVVVFLWALLPW